MKEVPPGRFRLILDWIGDAIGFAWLPLYLAVLLLPAPIFLVDDQVGAVALVYSLFWLHRGSVSFSHYCKERRGGLCREEWRRQHGERIDEAHRQAHDRIKSLLEH